MSAVLTDAAPLPRRIPGAVLALNPPPGRSSLGPSIRFLEPDYDDLRRQLGDPFASVVHGRDVPTGVLVVPGTTAWEASEAAPLLLPHATPTSRGTRKRTARQPS